MKTAVVTGASGFIGKALTKELLKNKVEVFAIVRNKNKVLEFIDNPNFHIIESELENYKNIDENLIKKDIDVFFHLSWEGTFGEKFKDYRLQMNNAIFSADAINLALRIRSKKFVMASTVNVLETLGYFEKYNIKPRYTCIYSTAKLSAEMICKTIAYQNNLDINIALIANSYGEGDYSQMLPNVLMKNLIEGKSPDLVEGNFLYDWIYIDDIVKSLCAIGDKGISQKNYYIGHEKLHTFKEIANFVRDIINPNVILKYGVYKDSTNIDYSKINLSELRIDTKYSPDTDFKESIIKTSKWLKENLNHII